MDGEIMDAACGTTRRTMKHWTAELLTQSVMIINFIGERCEDDYDGPGSKDLIGETHITTC